MAGARSKRGAAKRSKQEVEEETLSEKGKNETTKKVTEDADTADEPQEEKPNEETVAAGDDEDSEAETDKADADEPETEEPPAKRQATDVAKDGASKEGGDTGTKADSGKGAKPGAGKVDAQAPLEKKADIPDDVIEEGRIYFFYRPKVETEDPKSIDDLQRLFFILSPTSREGPQRMLAVGKKRMPKSTGHERFFGFVNAVDKSTDTLVEGLASNSYETKTKGTRTTPAARVAAQGVYSICNSNNGGNSGGGSNGGAGTTHMSYRLELPQEPGPVQAELGIAAAASFVLSIKNPDTPNPGPNAGLGDKADFPKEKMEQFGNYRWIGCRDPELLDYPRCEFLLVGAGEDKEATEHLQQLLESDVVKALHASEKGSSGAEDDEVAALLAKLRAELHPQKADLPTDPVQDGQWQ